MRTTWARGATCALAILLAVPALADKRARRSLSDCTHFTQTDKSEVVVELAVHNRCKAQIDCSISWKVVCAPQSRARRAVHARSAKFTLAEGAADRAEASAEICGDEAWSIESIQWGCEPSKD